MKEDQFEKREGKLCVTLPIGENYYHDAEGSLHPRVMKGT
jgi:hypothetical protein